MKLLDDIASNLNTLGLSNKQKIIVLAKIGTWIAFVVGIFIKEWALVIFAGLFVVWDLFNFVRDYFKMRKKHGQ